MNGRRCPRCGRFRPGGAACPGCKVLLAVVAAVVLVATVASAGTIPVRPDGETCQQRLWTALNEQRALERARATEIVFEPAVVCDERCRLLRRLAEIEREERGAADLRALLDECRP